MHLTFKLIYAKPVFNVPPFDQSSFKNIFHKNDANQYLFYYIVSLIPTIVLKILFIFISEIWSVKQKQQVCVNNCVSIYVE